MKSMLGKRAAKLLDLPQERDFTLLPMKILKGGNEGKVFKSLQ
jgi:hypothetical protein